MAISGVTVEENTIFFLQKIIIQTIVIQADDGDVVLRLVEVSIKLHRLLYLPILLALLWPRDCLTLCISYNFLYLFIVRIRWVNHRWPFGSVSRGAVNSAPSVCFIFRNKLLAIYRVNNYQDTSKFMYNIYRAHSEIQFQRNDRTPFRESFINHLRFFFFYYSFATIGVFEAYL